MKKKGVMVNWTDLPRTETTKKRLEDVTLPDGTVAINLDYGINLYRNAIKKNDCEYIINTLESEIAKNIPGIQWSGAQVNESQNVDDVRNCVDLKFKPENLGKHLPENQALRDIHFKVDKALDVCLNHYESLWHLKMHYKEAFNFVKYMPGKYFKIHGDHGPYYACTVSAVVYLNDDYEGGEIEFTRQGLVVKPQAGDIIMFPSNYVYEHASLEVFSGIKYSVVIMTDYNDLHHKGH
jgi:predicted 2-oxoglutarate/Fe(II)-dependent dioxygenase YbiX